MASTRRHSFSNWRVLYQEQICYSVGCSLGDNNRGCAGVVCEEPEGSRVMMQSKPEPSEGFDVIIRSEPEGASQPTLKQPGHYSHYNTKLTNYRYIHWKSCRTALVETGVAAILYMEIHRTLSLLHHLNATSGMVLTQGHKLTSWVWCMCLQLFNPCVSLCLIPNELF